MACIYCGGWSPSDDDDTRYDAVAHARFTREHGPGVCCTPCQYCREGVLHAERVCSDPNPKVRASQGRAFAEYHGHA